MTAPNDKISSFITGSLPHICGNSYSPHDECWQYTPLNDSWTKTSTSNLGTIPHGSAESTYHPSWGIIMTGGYNGDGDDEDDGRCCADKVAITNNALDYEILAPMPYDFALHCVVAIDANRLFITGLGGADDESFMYSKSTGEWASLPNMPTGRYRFGCGVVRDDSGLPEVVVFGGRSNGDYNTPVEIYSVEEESWRTGIEKALYNISSETNVSFLQLLTPSRLELLTWLSHSMMKRSMSLAVRTLVLSDWTQYIVMRSAMRVGN